MNRKRVSSILCFVIFLLLLSSVSAFDETLSVDKFAFYRDYLDLNLHVKGNISLDGDYESVNSLNAKLYQYPTEEDFVQISYFNPFPDYHYDNKTITYVFEKPISNIELYGFHAGMKIFQNKKLITKDSSFPLINVPSEYSDYLKQTEKILITNNIKTKASELVANSDGTIEAAFALASWINLNIKYEMSPVTESLVHSSDWVYSQRKGVCDELTTLFIAMARSVGIPARFVSGLAYSDSTKDFGNHAWAEIYLLEYGWVPFDVTYGEFLWLDSSHIPLQKTLDSNVHSVECSGTGGEVEILPDKLKTTVNISEVGEYVFPDLDIDFTFLSDNVGYGSYNVVEVEVENLESRYIATDIYISNVQNLNLTEGNKKFVLIPPRSKKKLYWVFKVDQDLAKNSLYIFPLEIYTNFNNSLRKKFNVSRVGIIYSETYIDGLLEKHQESLLREQSSNIEIICQVDRIYMVNEDSTFICSLTNTGDTDINNLDVCFKKQDCTEINIPANKKITEEITTKFGNLGLQTFILTLTNSDILKSEYINFNVKDVSDLNLAITNPDQIRFKEAFPIILNFTVNSVSRPKDVYIEFEGSGIHQEWSFPSLDINQVIELRLEGKHLFKDENLLEVKYSWKDEIGREHTESDEIKISLVDLNYWQKFYAFINKLINS